MKQLLVAFVLFGMAVIAIKVAFAFLILAGLIFRTGQTIAVLVVLALAALASAYPVAAAVVIVLAAGYALHRATRKPDAAVKLKAWRLTDDTDA